MLGLVPGMDVHICTGFTDGRLGSNGLSGLVMNKLNRDPRSGDLFVFCNRTRGRAAFLWYHDGGTYSAAKRMDRGAVDWPRNDAGVATMNMRQLEALLKGVEFHRPNNGVRR